MFTVALPNRRVKQGLVSRTTHSLFSQFSLFLSHNFNSFNNFNYNNNSNIIILINHYYHPSIHYSSQPSSISLKHTITVINTITPKNIIPDIISSPHLFTILKFLISSSVHSLILLINYSFFYTSLFRSSISLLRSTNQ